MTVWIDADACPVVDIAIALCMQYGVACMLVCDTAHVLQKQGAQTLTVDSGADSVDFVLVNRILPGDIVITQDYGLAAMCLARRAQVLNQNGMVYHTGNIESLLMQRHTAQKIRRGGGRLKGPPKRTHQQDDAFAQAFESLLSIATNQKE